MFLLSHCGDGELIDWALNPIPSCIASFTPRAPSSACRHVPPHACIYRLSSSEFNASNSHHCTLSYGASVRHATNAIVVQCGVKPDPVNLASNLKKQAVLYALELAAFLGPNRSNWFRFERIYSSGSHERLWTVQCTHRASISICSFSAETIRRQKTHQTIAAITFPLMSCVE